MKYEDAISLHTMIYTSWPGRSFNPPILITCRDGGGEFRDPAPQTTPQHNANWCKILWIIFTNLFCLHRVVKLKLLEHSKVSNIFLTGECWNMDAYTFYCRVIIGGESYNSTEFKRPCSYRPFIQNTATRPTHNIDYHCSGLLRLLTKTQRRCISERSSKTCLEEVYEER